MAASERDVTPMLSSTDLQSDEQDDSQFQKLTSRTRSASISIPMHSLDYYGSEQGFISHTGPLRNEKLNAVIEMSTWQANGATGQKTSETKEERYPSFNRMDRTVRSDNRYTGKSDNLLKSGPLGMCNDPYCTTCPSYYHVKGYHKKSKSSDFSDQKFHYMLYGDAKGWVKKVASFLQPYIPPVMNPHTKFVQQWNQFFVICCLFAIFLDPLFFFLLYVQQDNKCISLNWPMTKTLVVLRSLADLVYFIHILLQFRLAYVDSESRVVGAGDLVDNPKKIARHYLSGYFCLDLFIVLPLPQIIILLILPRSLGQTGANYAKNLLRAAILAQYIPRLYRFLPLLAGQSPIGLVFESAWANFIINLLTFVLSSHVVGSCWYLFGLQRVNQCLRDACRSSSIPECNKFIDCGHGDRNFSSFPQWQQWPNNVNATACFIDGNFDYGIYAQAVNLTTKGNVITRYTYALFWGFQQISTLAGNQIPSYFIWEVLFTMAIIGLGLLLFALLIGNMQNFLQSLGRRRLEMSLRRRDVEQWMSHRRLPEDLRRKVREAERYNWAATRGVNEEMLMENLPEDLQRDIRRHLFKFVKKVQIFTLMDEPILDAICERLRQKTYIKESKILYRGGLVDKMVFIIRGKIENIGEDGIKASLGEGDVIGEELLTSYLEHSSINKGI
ncbi:OLC1v1013869C1 [Oldenlandia corymbosa var. corymbosa]|uniref:OLC1v1013869C1 n=1 Tax=Oldenlandia corymbosa var. corymbosa TaxID=529605 RepID=A0AAV1E1I2_OLDCO|nr:OLC1v1013869C1 [Oldenlandia corymbosa var. corymbosa]